MKNRIKQTAVSARNHIHRHRGKYAAAATLIAMLELQQISNRQWVSFLEEKGIDPDEFFCPEYFEEKMQSI